jgi:hypothetical protein
MMDQVYNPETGRWVYLDGAVGRKLVKCHERYYTFGQPKRSITVATSCVQSDGVRLSDLPQDALLSIFAHVPLKELQMCATLNKDMSTILRSQNLAQHVCKASCEVRGILHELVNDAFFIRDKKARYPVALRITYQGNDPSRSFTLKFQQFNTYYSINWTDSENNTAKLQFTSYEIKHDTFARYFALDNTMQAIYQQSLQDYSMVITTKTVDALIDKIFMNRDPLKTPVVIAEHGKITRTLKETVQKLMAV